MKAPLKWLKKYVDIDVDVKSFSDAMTMSGTKVEGYEEVGEDISNVVIGKITSITPHPDADKLIITKIDTGSSEVQIVTGAKNVSVGDIIPVALHGSTLPGGIKIKKGKLRGEVSEGMLCSAKELGIDEKYVDIESRDGILLLRGEYTLGDDVRKALLLNDYIVEFELTSNRPDCQSIIGLAHEVSATLDKDVKLPESDFREIDKAIEYEVKVLDKDLCPRFIIREIKDIEIKPSPYFMQRCLIESGIRPINNIVDITNFVMLEYGQPLHAYDASKLSTKEFVIKRASDNDSFYTLDDLERKLDSEMLMITDGQKNIGIAGVMGGQNSDVSDTTTHIVLESANFNADNIRHTSKKLNLRTEASARFEKGIDLSRAEEAINRACHLIDYYGYGKVLSGKKDTLENEIEVKTVVVSIDRINKLLGEKLSPEKMSEILSKLKFKTEIQGNNLSIEVPEFRLDIDMEADIVEEIARLYGYNNILSQNIVGELTSGVKTEDRIFEDHIKDAMMSNGLTEVLTYSFVSPTSLEKIGENLSNAVKLINPLGEETSVMRTSLVPAMLEILSRNLSRKVDFFSGFEVGNIFSNPDAPVQKRAIVAGVYGKEEDFFTMKSRLEGVLDYIGIESRSYQPFSENELYHPMRCARITSGDEQIGFIGEVHPLIAEKFDIKKRVYLFTLDFDIISGIRTKLKLYKQVPKFPAIKRDIALVVSEEVAVGSIENLIISKGNSLIEKVELFDIYMGDQVPKGKKSVAYGITYRALDRTLTDEEINLVQSKILTHLADELGAHLREI